MSCSEGGCMIVKQGGNKINLYVDKRIGKYIFDYIVLLVMGRHRMGNRFPTYTIVAKEPTYMKILKSKRPRQSISDTLDILITDKQELIQEIDGLQDLLKEAREL